VLSNTGTTSIRERDLPVQVVVYCVIALALYMQSSYREALRCLLEGVQWQRDPSAGMRLAGKSGISQACTRRAGSPFSSRMMNWSSPSRYGLRVARGIRPGDW